MSIVWSPTARADLRLIEAYIAERNPRAAAKVARAILTGVQGLPRFPGFGRPGRVPDTRELVISNTPYIVPYRVVGLRIDIIVVIHGARRWPDSL
jgi:toxin ParE1/3/4